jgi:hypothetical protein
VTPAFDCNHTRTLEFGLRAIVIEQLIAKFNNYQHIGGVYGRPKRIVAKERQVLRRELKFLARVEVGLHAKVVH